MQINLTPDPSLLAIIVIFLLNYVVVRRYFLQPINEIIDQRETETRSAERVYEESLARFSEATSKMEQQLHAAKREASAVRERFRGEAATYRGELVEKTQGQAREVVDVAATKLKGEVEVARATIVRDSESLARLAAERLLGRTV